MQAYDGKYGAGKTDMFAAQAYDTVQIPLLAYRQVVAAGKTDLTQARLALRDAIEATREYRGVNGLFSYSPTDHLGLDRRSTFLVTVRTASSNCWVSKDGSHHYPVPGDGRPDQRRGVHAGRPEPGAGLHHHARGQHRARQYVTFGALTLASFVEGTLAPVVYVVAAGGAAACPAGPAAGAGQQPLAVAPAGILPGGGRGAGRADGAGLARALAAAADAGLAGALVAALGPIVYRLTIEPNPANSTVVLVIIGVGVSMIMHPLALLLWGADPRAVPPISEARLELAGVDIAAQSLFIMAFSLAAAWRCTCSSAA